MLKVERSFIEHPAKKRPVESIIDLLIPSLKIMKLLGRHIIKPANEYTLAARFT
jgi:hypothetical protein